MEKVLKCKVCGGDIELTNDKTLGTCLYCGSTMTFPKYTDEQRINAFNRGNHFRRIGEFDKALSIYESIIKEDNTDAEAHWCAAISRFGIEYVEDPVSMEYVPTCHRASFDGFLDDIDYQEAVKNSDGVTQRQYIKDGNKIDEIQKAILATSSKESPFDVFICYKESDANGQRTQDSVLAQEIYYSLTEKGFKTFFSRITLEDKVGTEYEPYIFAALNSAKVMVVVGTSHDNLNAVWVKNEWSRFITLMKKDCNKVLLPCYKDMDPYDMPEALAILQSYNMASIGFMQDLSRGIEKIVKPSKGDDRGTTAKVDVDAYKKRIAIFLENGDFERALSYCDKVLDFQPEDAETYIYKLCAELQVKNRASLRNLTKSFEKMSSYQNAIRFGTTADKKELEEILRSAVENEKAEQKDKKEKMKLLAIVALIVAVIMAFTVVAVKGVKAHEQHKRAEQLADAGDFYEALSVIEESGIGKKDSELTNYVNAGLLIEKGDYKQARSILEKMSEYKNAKSLLLKCDYLELKETISALTYEDAQKALEKMEAEGYGNVDEVKTLVECKRIEEEITTYFDNTDYGSCLGMLKKLKQLSEDEAQMFISVNQSAWYVRMVNLANSIEYYDENMAIKVTSLANMCGSDYKDVQKYLDYIKCMDTSLVSKAFTDISDIKVAKWYLWSQKNSWFTGNWMTLDGKYYLDVDSMKYNLPADNSKFTGNGEFTFNDNSYVYRHEDDVLGSRHVDTLFEFYIQGKNEIKVKCNKDGSSFILYKN